MSSFFLWLHVAFGLLFIAAVLIQDKGTGLSATFGGTGGFYATQRGAAKVLHTLTVVFIIAFLISALLTLAAPKWFPQTYPSVPSAGPSSAPVLNVKPSDIKVETQPAKPSDAKADIKVDTQPLKK